MQTDNLPGTPENPRAVPADERTTREYVGFAERHAAELRRHAGVAAAVPMDPYALLGQFNLVVMKLDDLPMTEEDRAFAAGISPRTWSGGGGRKELPDGSMLVILHPDQTLERARVTIMEEVAHRYFGHKPVALKASLGGAWDRGYNPISEREAYWTAAATLLPSICVGRAIWQRRSAASVAEEFGVSVELFEFRVKTLRLWSQYLLYRDEGS